MDKIYKIVSKSRLGGIVKEIIYTDSETEALEIKKNISIRGYSVYVDIFETEVNWKQK